MKTMEELVEEVFVNKVLLEKEDEICWLVDATEDTWEGIQESVYEMAEILKRGE